jgi:MFS family permease
VLGALDGNRPAALITVTCVAAVLAMISYAVWPVFLISLGPAWGMTNTEIGWISGAYFIGYVVATPVLVGLTDTVDAKRVFIGGSLAAVVGSAGFATVADGFWGAALTWSLVGAGLAGTYMPGLQILNARLSDKKRLMAVPFYTSCFGVAAWIGSAGAMLAILLILFGVKGHVPAPRPEAARRHPLDLRPAFRNRPALGYIFAYGAHTYELFAYRGWSFAMFAFIGATATPALSLSFVTILVSLLTLTGMAASIIGARYCLAYGRRRVITFIGALSAGFAVLSALSLSGPVWLALACLWIYNICIMLDSGALTAGTVAAAAAHERGALLAVHSMIGFSGGALGGPAVGMMLDLGGGEASLDAWFWAILVMGIGSSMVAVIQWRAWRRFGNGD